jgi:hypothetical protein
MNTTNPAFGYWSGEDLPPRRPYEYQTWGWPPKTVEGYSNPYGADANPSQLHGGRRGFKTDRVTHDAANAFIRGSYVAGSSD